MVASYRRAKRLLELLEAWKQGEEGKVRKAFSLGMDLPLYSLFHLLCPGKFRESSAVVTGDLERVWGNPELLESPSREM